MAAAAATDNPSDLGSCSFKLCADFCLGAPQTWGGQIFARHAPGDAFRAMVAEPVALGSAAAIQPAHDTISSSRTAIGDASARRAMVNPAASASNTTND